MQLDGDALAGDAGFVFNGNINLNGATLTAARWREPSWDIWEEELERFEGIGAALESERPGEAFFAVDGLLGIHGGRRSGVVEALSAASLVLLFPVL